MSKTFGAIAAGVRPSSVDSETPKAISEAGLASALSEFQDSLRQQNATDVGLSTGCSNQRRQGATALRP